MATALDTDMVTVDYPDGNRIAIRVPHLTDEQKATIARVVAGHGLTDDQLPQMAVVLAEQIHDEAIYRKVAEQRGVLAL